MQGTARTMQQISEARKSRFEVEDRGVDTMNEYVPCKRRDPTAWEAIGRVRREEKERRRREQQERESEADEERSEEDARV